MFRITNRYWLLSILLFLSLLIISGCTGNSSGYSLSITPEGAYPIEAIFREFYDHMGGEKVLGPAISPLFVYANHKYQYLQAGCLEYNPDAPPDNQFRLSPLGLDMGVADPAVSDPDQPGQVFIAGHVIYSGFVPMYRKMGGARFVGKPLTEVHYNPEKKRFEQYFENLGFYWVENQPPEAVQLLAYGAWKCDSHCRHVPPLSAAIDLPGQTNKPTDKLFKKYVKELGSDFTGYEISPPYLAPDGMYEQIFENLVLTADPKNPDIINLRPVPEKVGILPEAPVYANGFQGMIFWLSDGERGHNVPQDFVDYINKHLGPEISGPPVSELFLVGDSIFRQCFTKICLDYHLRDDVPQSLRIKTSPLGRAYKELYYRPQSGNFIQNQSLKATSMQVWERESFISSSQTQEIGVSVFDGESPVVNIEPVVILTLPEGAEMTYYFPPTGEDGKSLVRLNPIEATNGSIVEYKVCLDNGTGEPFCVKDSFVIWFNP